MEDLIQRDFRKDHCSGDGTQSGPVDFNAFRQKMYGEYASPKPVIKSALNRLDREVCIALCRRFALNSEGDFLDGKAVIAHLHRMRPDKQKLGAISIFESIRAENIEAVKAGRRAETTGSGNASTRSMSTGQSRTGSSANSSSDIGDVSYSSDSDSLSLNLVPDSILTTRLGQLAVANVAEVTANDQANRAATERTAPDFQLFERLLVNGNRHAAASTTFSATQRIIRQAPLVTADIVEECYKDLLPQYGLIGTIEDAEDQIDPQLFLNTNVPFSAFICGVQGSGKSHTTSCLLENSILTSRSLGNLESPLATLVFSYGDWSGRGAGFSISEATFLAAAHTDYPNHHVKKVTVLYSPSNAAIRRLYQRLPNVEMVPFRLKAHTLDIGALHTLMAIDEKSTIPLYMATVEGILRSIASESLDGSMNYLEFKRRLAKERFDPTQTAMLRMRMNLLESFLDLTGNAPMPDFTPGEITIIDLSDPFLTPSTACILFKLGLEQFLQSPASGKMVVLDEAHKYMLDTPGSRILTDCLTRTIRLQRHQGARVVISTQEPTIAPELIALCSVTIMHRFSSPAWYAALRKHINAVDDDKDVMQQIEGLETGEALVYAPSAVLGKYEDGDLQKGVGRLLKVRVRKRVTLDGGVSIMAV